jgi:methionyl-tRNA formyltransferase
MAALRLIFMGTPDLARVSLEALLASSGFEVVASVTQPDRPKGRDLKLQASPVKQLSVSHGLPVFQPERMRDEQFLAALRSFQPDLIVVAAYGRILPQGILDLPRFGCLNVHTSLLPKYRGAAPIQRAILNDEPETGVTIMKMGAGMDTGDILTQQATPIQPQDTAITLHDRLATIGAELLVRTIKDYAAGRIPASPQPVDGATYAAKIKKEDGQIDWQRPARAIWNQVRGLVPWPGAFTQAPGPSASGLLKIWQTEVVDTNGQPGEILSADKSGIVVGCGGQALRILVLQREGGRRLSAQEFLTGHYLASGQRLG